MKYLRWVLLSNITIYTYISQVKKLFWNTRLVKFDFYGHYSECFILSKLSKVFFLLSRSLKCVHGKVGGIVFIYELFIDYQYLFGTWLRSKCIQCTFDWYCFYSIQLGSWNVIDSSNGDISYWEHQLRNFILLPFSLASCLPCWKALLYFCRQIGIIND